MSARMTIVSVAAAGIAIFLIACQPDRGLSPGEGYVDVPGGQVWYRIVGSGRALVDRVYGHLGEIRHRSEVVEYRVSQHLQVDGYKERMRVLREKGGLKLLA